MLMGMILENSAWRICKPFVGDDCVDFATYISFIIL